MPIANPRAAPQAAMADDSTPGVLIFAKAPIPGRCKTRLAHGANNIRAARIYRALLENAVAAASRYAPGRVTLVCAPNTRDPLFARLGRRYRVARIRQVTGGLGRRMYIAACQGLRHHPAVLVMGADQPRLDDDWLCQAGRHLRTPEAAWLAPTRDGGYWALGMVRAEARVFTGPRWSTARVARQTRRRLARAGTLYREYTEREDIDEWRDWCRLAGPRRQRLSRLATMPGLGSCQIARHENYPASSAALPELA